MARTSRHRLWKYLRGFGPPLIIWGVFVALLLYLQGPLFGDNQASDEVNLQEWIREAQIDNKSLPGLVREYVTWTDQQAANWDQLSEEEKGSLVIPLKVWQIKMEDFLRALAEPTKKYLGQMPFFLVVYRIELEFQDRPGPQWPRTIAWDSDVPRLPSQYQDLSAFPIHNRVLVHMQYQLYAYNKRYRDEQAARSRMRWLLGLAAAATAVAFLWMYLVHRREREREQQRALAQQQIDQAERLLLVEELRRQEAEHRQEESERRLLEQRLAAQESERQLLELKSQLFANIGIMAGSYAHNIKNLLVRPNDLLRRCLEADRMAPDQQQMLAEVRQTLGTVTERLQQILQTVRRDPSQAELTRIDLNALAGEMQRNWEDLAREKWKLSLTVELCPGPLEVEGDLSHLQQAAENLLFNARDATFEMRNHLREQARRGEDGGGLEDRRQALIAAAAWRGRVCLRTRRDEGRAVFEVEDNGIGMTDEVCRRCTETHFSTKRNNAIYEGYNSGMGLGLSFVLVILEHHGAALTIGSEPLKGTTFRVSFPLAGQGPWPRVDGQGASRGADNGPT
jgi:signal transduction histidine kinase